MVSKNYMFQTPLFFSHGLEIENHLVAAQTGEVLVGNDLLSTWEDMFSNAFEYLKKIKKDKKTPNAIRKKIVKIEVKEETKREKRLSFIFVHYKLGKKTIKVNVFGPDPNISQITWLLELVTPPCEYLEELSFWVDTLYAAALHGLSKSKTKSALLPIGLNPMETRVRSGLTCGEHHHIGVPSFLRAPIYNLLRNFIPHLIALSTSSPFLNKQPSSKINLREKNGKQQVISRGVHSYRLMHNTGQMGPNLPQYLPIIGDITTREEFANQVKKTPPDDRMIDMFPFTDYSTIELRFFDAQPWTENRLAIVLLIQAIAQKAKDLIKSKTTIPTASSKSLYENRRKAIQYGLLAQFSRDEQLTGDFSWFYNFDIENSKPASKLLHSVLGMLIYLEDELLIFNSTYIDYLLLPVLGTKKYAPPFTVCDYLFALYTEQSNNIEKFLKKLYYNDKGKYPPQVAGDFSSFVVSDPPESFSKVSQKKVGLTKLLQKDLATKQEIPTKKKAKPKRKAKPRTKPKPREVKQEVIQKKAPVKKIPKKPIVKKVDTPKVEPKKVKKKEKKVKTKEPSSKLIKTKKMEIKKPLKKPFISAFDENEDLEIYSPNIEVEPKYQKINSKIANVMRTRRKEIELKRVVFFKEHLKTEEADFRPFPKKASAAFPALISGSELFGYIEISFSNIKKVMYKFRNNPIILKVYDNKTDIEIATLRTFVDISSLEKRQMVQIPVSIDIGELYGKITLRVECVTGTNERLLKKGFSFSFTRKDEIAITPEEFFVTGNYGSQECVYKAVNNSKNTERGELTLLLATQSLTAPLVIHQEKFTLKPGATFELAKSINLSIDYQHSSFYILARTTVGTFKKNRTFKSIHVPVLREIVIDWSFATRTGSRYDLWQGVQEKTHYQINFVFHFLKDITEILSMTIYVNTFPQGETKKLTSVKMKRWIDKGDEFIVPTIKFKTPKKCGYIIFDVQIRTEKGLLPYHLISDPIGVHSLIVNTSFEKRRDLDL